MNRQKEIDRIASVISEMPATTQFHFIKDFARHLVDNGIGTKDRFELRPGLNPWGNNSKTFIKPIDYKED